MKTKTVVVCDECGKTIYPCTSLNDLICLPYEWYMDKNLFKRYDIYQCVDCRRIFRKRKLLKYYFNTVKGILKNW